MLAYIELHKDGPLDCHSSKRQLSLQAQSRHPSQIMPESAAPQMLLLFAIACLVAAGSADEATSIVMVEAEPYVQLDTETHLAALEDPDIWLVEFFSPMCGSCAEFKTTWMEVASALNGQVSI
jgi:thioredoxin-like negative regulator of GroEL